MWRTTGLALFALLLTTSTLWAATAPRRGETDRPRQPPAEAFSACSAASEGDACSFEAPRGTIQGTCRVPPRRSELICVPAHHRSGRRGGGSERETR